jgi:hypothetical protein
LDQVTLAAGTKLAYDPASGQSGVRNAGLPVLNIDNIDADLYFKTRDGSLHVESTKWSAGTLASTLKKSRESGSDPTQIARQADWAHLAQEGEPRQAGYYMLDGKTGFLSLMNDTNLAQLGRTMTDPSARKIIIGDRAYSLNDLHALSADAQAMAARHVEATRAAAADPASFDSEVEFKKFYRANAGTPEQAMRALGKTYGEKAPPLNPLSTPSIRQGALWGAAAAGGISLIQVAQDGKITLEDAKVLGESLVFGTAVGAVAAKGEQLVMPLVDRVIGTTVQTTATSTATKLGAAAAADSTGLFARTMTTRVVGSTLVGTAITAGVSFYENRELVHGDSKAIGNFTADTVVAAGSIAAATATGAAIGSVVPVAGTAVGAVVGLAVGVGITYGAQLSGARDAVAAGVSKAVDWVKGWF